MKKKTKALIAMMSLCAVGTVGSAFALTRNGATATGTPGAFDKAIYLYWGETNTSVELADCENLTANVPVYRYVTVSPQSTKSVAGTLTVSFELEKATDTAEKKYHIDGLTVNVYRTNVEAITDENVATYAVDANKKVSLTSEALTNQDTFAIETSTEKHQTTFYYAIEVVYDGTYVANSVLGGEVNISQSFSAN